MGKQAENERRGDLIGRVRDADVEIRQFGFDKVTDDNFEAALFWSRVDIEWTVFSKKRND